MLQLSPTDLITLEESATTAAAYLDACDAGAQYARLDPDYYQACGRLLLTIFSVANAAQTFPELVQQSPSAREMAETVEIGHRIEVSRLGYYPELTVILNRASA